MKASITWLNRFANNQLSVDDQDLVDQIGQQLGAVEEVVALKDKYQMATVVEIVKCHKLPGSDHLNVCFIQDNQAIHTVDRDSDGLVQVVCGANNVKVGLKVVWLPPGSIVPSSVNAKPIVLSAKKLLNTVSNGMLASGKELDINEDHEGILELDDSFTIGQSLNDAFNYDDKIIDIENKMFTHRPDLFGQLGIAREIAGIRKQTFVNPSWYEPKLKLANPQQSVIRIDNQLLSKNCLRFMAFRLDNVTVKPSPIWLQSLLSRVGLRPINNIVDITNYVMMSVAQPMHAYDWHKLATTNESVDITIRQAKHKEQLTLLDKRHIELSNDDIVIADNKGAIGLAGIMGGYDSQVSNDTTTILVECATFNMYQIRRSSMYHGIFSEAVARFNKGQSPLQCPAAINLFMALVNELMPEAQLVTTIEDSLSPNIQSETYVQLDERLLNTYLGQSLDNAYVTSLLNNVGVETSFNSGCYRSKVPFWRIDLQQPEDIIEEVARLHGFNQLPITPPLRSAQSVPTPDLIKLTDVMRQLMSKAGGNEVLNYSFTDKSLLDNCRQDSALLYKLSNAISPKLQFYRGNILPGLLSRIHPNHKAKFNQFCLFEIGKVHRLDTLDDESLPMEFSRFAAVYSADDHKAESKYYGSAYFTVKYYLNYLLLNLNVDVDKLSFKVINAASLAPQWQDAVKMFNINASAAIYLGDLFIGFVGEFHPLIQKNLKLPNFCAGMEIDLDQLMSQVNSQQPYKPLSNYPKIYEDITLVVSTKFGYHQVKEHLIKNLRQILPNEVEFEVSDLDIYQAQDGDQLSDTIAYTFAMALYSYQQTLRQTNVADWLKKIHQIEQIQL